MKQSPIISPSLLSANFAQLANEAAEVIDAGAQWLHVDVMDNHFVPNLTMGPIVCEALRRSGITVPLDVHLMVTNPENLIDAFAKAGASIISIHAEVTPHLDKYVQHIRDVGCKAGLALNPSTPLHHIPYLLEKLDMVLIMSVNPGFSGQRFIPAVFDKIRHVREMIDHSGLPIRLCVDGGITVDNMASVSRAGADTFVAGSAVFNAQNKQTAVKQLIASVDGCS
ncbi:MAG: ribulose-phosphate 3-epimerase [Gammaproteobacteria bacterium]|nr:ribulose-phosphate 3-epimerase [Gammaproteobacteria bacterium]MCD8542628.1 ribulose-phosphate 3-epimerase [Gammaproteobacteria bacterium]